MITKYTTQDKYTYVKFKTDGSQYENAMPSDFMGKDVDKAELNNSTQCIAKYGYVNNGSSFYAMDTGNAYLYNETDNTWHLI